MYAGQLAQTGCLKRLNAWINAVAGIFLPCVHLRLSRSDAKPTTEAGLRLNIHLDIERSTQAITVGTLTNLSLKMPKVGAGSQDAPRTF